MVCGLTESPSLYDLGDFTLIMTIYRYYEKVNHNRGTGTRVKQYNPPEPVRKDAGKVWAVYC